MSGTMATYQGLPCRDVRFRRTRGWRADTTTVVLFAADLPGSFEFATPEPGELPALRSEVRLDLRQLHWPGLPRPLLLPRRLDFAGALVLAEVDRQGREYRVVVDPLYCVSVETIRRSDDGAVAAVQLQLVDARYFFAQGFVRRWSFNRLDAAGQYTRDSVQPSGQPFTLQAVAKDVAAQLYGAPILSRTPDTWAKATAAVELPHFVPAAVGLAKLAQEHGAGELCLALDGSVALYRPGEGRVGYAPEGRGPDNAADLPERLLLDLKGTGQSRGWQATYPPDYLVVVGGLRVASVRLDDLDPVLVIEGVPVPLTEETVRRLTGGRYGLEWLHVFVLAPQAYQSAVDLDPRVAALFREQAYRYWRLPGVEASEPFREAKGPAGAPRLPSPVRPQDAPRPLFEEIVAGLRRATADEPTASRGPNAHLLPLLDRAETVSGRRLPVGVETYRFASVHRSLAPSQDAVDAATAQRELAELRNEIRQAARAKGKPDPFDGVSWYLGFDSRYMTTLELQGIFKGLRLKNVRDEQFQRAINQHRLLDRINEASPGLAGDYKNNLIKLYELEGKAGGPGKALFDLAAELVDFERNLAKEREAFETPDEEARDQARHLRERIQDELRALDRQVEDQRLRTRVDAKPQPKERLAVFVRNLPRDVDPNARVYSAELGVIVTSDLCGHVKEEGVPVAEATSFVPRSPLVTFGAVLRPSLASRRVQTGGAEPSGAKVPAVLSDRESYYVAAFKRTSQRRAEPIELYEVPAGLGVAVERPDLVELVPLEGESNRARLDETAETIAAAAFDRPDKVEQARYTVARPWPVNCDGVVAGVEIVLRPNGKGFVTTVHTGSEAPKLAPLGRTRVRIPRRVASDAAAREGLLP